MWDHISTNWKTSLSGLLIAIATVAGVLTQQGITLGTAGTGTVVALVAALATALMGLLAEDPGTALKTMRKMADARRISGMDKLGAVMLIALLLAGTMPVMATQGCSGSTVINEINIVLNEAGNVLAVAEPGASWIAPLKNAIAKLESAETTWQTGGTVAIVDDALNALSIVLAPLPLTAVYSPLIDVLMSGIEAVLAALPVSVSLKAQMARLTVAENPHAGRYRLVNHWYHTPAGNLKANWNDVAKAHGLLQMVLK